MFELIVASSVIFVTVGGVHAVPTVIAIELLSCEPQEFETWTK